MKFTKFYILLSSRLQRNIPLAFATSTCPLYFLMNQELDQGRAHLHSAGSTWHWKSRAAGPWRGWVGKAEICLLSMNLDANTKTERPRAIAQNQLINPYLMEGRLGVHPNAMKSPSLVFLQTLLQSSKLPPSEAWASGSIGQDFLSGLCQSVGTV